MGCYLEMLLRCDVYYYYFQHKLYLQAYIYNLFIYVYTFLDTGLSVMVKVTTIWSRQQLKGVFLFPYIYSSSSFSWAVKIFALDSGRLRW